MQRELPAVPLFVQIACETGLWNLQRPNCYPKTIADLLEQLCNVLCCLTSRTEGCVMIV